MTPAAYRQDRDERPDPNNRLLDAFETTVEGLKEHGLEVQLRARLARLLPPEQPSKLTLEEKLGFANVLSVLMRNSRRRDTEAGHKQNAAARDFVLAKLKGA